MGSSDPAGRLMCGRMEKQETLSLVREGPRYGEHSCQLGSVPPRGQGGRGVTQMHRKSPAGGGSPLWTRAWRSTLGSSVPPQRCVRVLAGVFQRHRDGLLSEAPDLSVHGGAGGGGLRGTCPLGPAVLVGLRAADAATPTALVQLWEVRRGGGIPNAAVRSRAAPRLPFRPLASVLLSRLCPPFPPAHTFSGQHDCPAVAALEVR